ncbi:Uncharacterised protein [uncultured Roseburia sp.]|uniref:Uncharacterized protein n=1 Tax=Brotonthovivens ammoniilytica TaxID=2981725 RepID=A0ABT2TLC5_9FIRM|nr:hypothetical protein [Brotonthovivens ammoniilytica]MCU6763009.1 hypothetical protein [Brotonthovivens ammoniilytica]SCJ00320.1 Uncharacterised protein [uncultured Roseburia sp.]
MGLKIIHEPGVYMDCTPMHGKWCDIDLVGKDVGYAQVGIISSGKSHILFQYKNKRGIVPKAYIKQLREVRMTEWKRKRQQPLIIEDWDDTINPYEMFLGKKCDIHVHQTRLFEASPGYFKAEIMYVGENMIKFRENSQVYSLNEFSICGMMES